MRIYSIIHESKHLSNDKVGRGEKGVEPGTGGQGNRDDPGQLLNALSLRLAHILAPEASCQMAPALPLQQRSGCLLVTREER